MATTKKGREERGERRESLNRIDATTSNFDISTNAEAEPRSENCFPDIILLRWDATGCRHPLRAGLGST